MADEPPAVRKPNGVHAQTASTASLQDSTPRSVPGAHELLAHLVHEHRAAVQLQVERLLGDHHAAQDIVQETFLRAWHCAGQLQAGRGSMRGWLLTVARNLAIDRLRSAAARREVSSDDLPEAGQRSQDVGDLVAGSSFVTTTLATLSDEHRSVLFCTVVAGLSVEQTASRLGLPVGTVKSRRHYALRRLRCALDAHDHSAAA